MLNDFTYFEIRELSEVVSLAYIDDEASYTVAFRFDSVNRRLWLVRGLKDSFSTYYLECFEFKQYDSRWGLRGWAEEETIPYIDCPLELLSLTNTSVDEEWRSMVYSGIATANVVPEGLWLYCGGLECPNTGLPLDYIKRTATGYEDRAGASVNLPDKIISSLLMQGNGVAYGTA